MMYTMCDIQNLLANATPDEQKQLAELLALDLEGIAVGKRARALVEQLWWRYQTPLGYLTRDASFDEICVAVAKALKLGGLADAEISSWTLLGRLTRAMLERTLEQMTSMQREAFAKEMFTPDQLKQFTTNDTIDWEKVSVAALLLGIKRFGGFATYKVALIVANQAARALLGRGLTLATNALLTRTLSLVLGPVGWILLIWGLNDLLGTNYKRVIPAVFFIYSIYERLRNEG